jgi:uncharacterized protein (DUF2384 family)
MVAPDPPALVVTIRLAALKTRLLQIYTPAEADEWMHTPQRLLEGHRPIDMLSNTLTYLDVDNAIDGMLGDTYL